MKAMLEPRIVAARIQCPACFMHGTSASIDRMMASSHGGFIKAMDALFVCVGLSTSISIREFLKKNGSE
jgi:hypothetical protein